MPSCSQNVWLIGWILVFYRDVLVSCNYNLKKLYWFIFSSGKPSHAQEFFFEMDKWLSLKACALSPATMNLWIHFSILLGFLQETWSLEDELKKEASGTFTCKDPRLVIGCGLRNLELHSLWKQLLSQAAHSSHYSGAKGMKDLETLRKKKTSAISRFFFFFFLYLPLTPSHPLPHPNKYTCKGCLKWRNAVRWEVR